MINMFFSNVIYLTFQEQYSKKSFMKELRNNIIFQKTITIEHIFI